MRRRVTAIFGKTVGDLSAPKWLLTYLITFGFVLFFFGIAFGGNVLEDIDQLPLELQEELLMTGYVSLSIFWGVGLPLLVAGAVFGSLTLATEAERGTLQMILSKPVRRLEVFFASYLASVVFLTLLGVAGMILTALVLVEFSSVAPAAIEGGVIELIPVNLAFTLVVAILMAGLALSIGVVTRSRLQTVLISLLLPVLFLVMWLVRTISPGFYEDYSLYLVDANYHLGHVYDLLADVLGVTLSPSAKDGFSTFSGVYETTATASEPVHESLAPQSVELVEYVSPAVSVAILGGVLLVALVLALVSFHSQDI